MSTNKGNKPSTTPQAPADSEPVVKKKIQPYPIPALIGAEGPARAKIDIRKLTQIGFIAEVYNQVFKVADEFPCVFEIPAMHEVIKCNLKVIKTYDLYIGKQKDGSVASRMVEFHFIMLMDHQSEIIKDFLVRIKQT